MAEAGQVVEDRRTGEVVRFVRTAADTGGRLLELECRWRPGGRTAAHAHPGMEERWEVLEGEACVVIAGRLHRLRAGESAVAPRGVEHRAWAPGPDAARVRITMTPALRWETCVERLFAAQDRGASPQELGALLAEFPQELALGRRRSPPAP